MDYNCGKNGTRTDGDQSQTGDDFRVSYESAMDDPEHRAWMTALLHDSADRYDTVCKCYFIGGDEGPIKIGYAANVRDRLRDMQSGCPIILKVWAVAAGGVEREIAYHYQFRDFRLHGEWFERVPAIEAEIKRLNRPESACSAPKQERNIG